MIDAITKARQNGDSVGGVVECIAYNLPAGLGGELSLGLEGRISGYIYSIPAVKGVEFGAGFDITKMLGSEANDNFCFDNGKVVTETNNNGGINGGITNGMPIIFRCAVKPTPTISKNQQTVDFINMQNTEILAGGRHDPCIVHRARVVVDSVTALVLCDILATRFGTDWLA